MFLQELSTDFVLLPELRLKDLDFGEVGVFLPFDIGRVRLAFKGRLAVFKKNFLPVVEIDDTRAVLVPDLRDGHRLDEVFPQNRDSLLRH